ncbi:MAG TPA: hypothetical protein VI076_08620, partial [Actinopolymorphaceae bacterium]
MITNLRRVLQTGGIVGGLLALSAPTVASAMAPLEPSAPSDAARTGATSSSERTDVDDLCGDLVRIEVDGPDLCSPGPETMPGVLADGPARPLPESVARAHVAAHPIVCEGDGVDGKRVQVLYAREQGRNSRYEHFLPSFRAWSHEIDAAYNDSAAQTGGSRHIRWVTEQAGDGCRIRVEEVVLPDGALESWDTMIPALQEQGYSSADRKYLVYADAQAVCGVGTLYPDDRPGPDNPNNTNTGYARVDATANCWGFNAAGH